MTREKILLMRIYKIIDGRIHSVKIKKLGNVCILKEPPNACFGWRNVFRKGECSFSIQKAFEKEIKAQNEIKKEHIEEIQNIDLQLVVLNRNLNNMVQNERSWGEI